MLGLAPWFRNWRKVAAAAGHKFLRGHWALFWDGHWVSEIHCPSCKGHHPVRPHWPNSQEASPASFPQFGVRVISTQNIQGLQGHTRLLLGLWPPLSSFSFLLLLPLFLRGSPPTMCIPRVGPGRGLGPVLFMSVSLRLHCPYWYHADKCMILWLALSREPGIQQTGALPLGTRGASRDSFVNEVALCYSSLTTNDLSQSHNFIFVVWPKKPSFPKRASSVYGIILLLIHSFKKY